MLIVSPTIEPLSDHPQISNLTHEISMPWSEEICSRSRIT